MNLKYRPIEEKDKKEICSWKYENEYSIYNLKSYDEQKQLELGFCNPKRQKNYYSIFDNDRIVAFINLTEYDSEIFLGVGVNPNLLSKGYGKKSIKIAFKIAKKLYPNKSMYLEVRSWNKRALNCYKSAGFVVEGAPFMKTTLIGEGEFYRMISK